MIAEAVRQPRDSAGPGIRVGPSGSAEFIWRPTPRPLLWRPTFGATTSMAAVVAARSRA